MLKFKKIVEPSQSCNFCTGRKDVTFEVHSEDRMRSIVLRVCPTCAGELYAGFENLAQG
jgi:hypothetical protein